MTLAQMSIAAVVAWTVAVSPAAAQTPEPRPEGQSTIAAALDLYAAASYDEALAALDTARRAQPGADDLVIIERHRLLCLVALGRTTAAQDVVAGLLDVRPDFVLTANEASPRVRAVFDAARVRALPDLVRRRYADGKRAYEAGTFTEARDTFGGLVALLADPALLARDPALADLATLAAGFLRLSDEALARERRGADVHAMTAAPPVRRETGAGSDSAGEAVLLTADAPQLTMAMWPPAVRAEAPPEVAPPFAPLGIFTYDWRDADVVAPVPVAQPVSGWWGSMGEPAAGTQLGAVEMVVNESGVVTDARIYLSVNRVYDTVLLESVKQWRYRPAMKDGRPVKYRRVTGVVSGR